ncbi:unnamed protein product [Euphydryas editha]|uniref:Uncharacterized protein n=1 Tax=Euphydryas editha TaxID=104508 RepID=A0AAU9U9J9_EUPED|nr:unnamed protein product [Euphydryas editha]
MKTTRRIDTKLLSQYGLASRGLAFRGDNETLGSQNNGDYLGCLELLCQSLISYVKFDQYQTAAEENNPYANYKDTFERKQFRSKRITFFEGSS